MAKKSMGESLYDIRVLSRHVQKSLLTKKDLSKFIESLPDDAGEGEPVVIEEDGDTTSMDEE